MGMVIFGAGDGEMGSRSLSKGLSGMDMIIEMTASLTSESE
jgi:hypothetical protein